MSMLTLRTLQVGRSAPLVSTQRRWISTRAHGVVVLITQTTDEALGKATRAAGVPPVTASKRPQGRGTTVVFDPDAAPPHPSPTVLDAIQRAKAKGVESPAIITPGDLFWSDIDFPGIDINPLITRYRSLIRRKTLYDMAMRAAVDTEYARRAIEAQKRKKAADPGAMDAIISYLRTSADERQGVIMVGDELKSSLSRFGISAESPSDIDSLRTISSMTTAQLTQLESKTPSLSALASVLASQDTCQVSLNEVTEGISNSSMNIAIGEFVLQRLSIRLTLDPAPHRTPEIIATTTAIVTELVSSVPWMRSFGTWIFQRAVDEVLAAANAVGHADSVIPFCKGGAAHFGIIKGSTQDRTSDLDANLLISNRIPRSAQRALLNICSDVVMRVLLEGDLALGLALSNEENANEVAAVCREFDARTDFTLATGRSDSLVPTPKAEILDLAPIYGSPEQWSEEYILSLSPVCTTKLDGIPVAPPRYQVYNGVEMICEARVGHGATHKVSKRARRTFEMLKFSGDHDDYSVSGPLPELVEALLPKVWNGIQNTKHLPTLTSQIMARTLLERLFQSFNFASQTGLADAFDDAFSETLTNVRSSPDDLSLISQMTNGWSGEGQMLFAQLILTACHASRLLAVAEAAQATALGLTTEGNSIYEAIAELVGLPASAWGGSEIRFVVSPRLGAYLNSRSDPSTMAPINELHVAAFAPNGGFESPEAMLSAIEPRLTSQLDGFDIQLVKRQDVDPRLMDSAWLAASNPTDTSTLCTFGGRKYAPVQVRVTTLTGAPEATETLRDRRFLSRTRGSELHEWVKQIGLTMDYDQRLRLKAFFETFVNETTTLSTQSSDREVLRRCGLTLYTKPTE